MVGRCILVLRVCILTMRVVLCIALRVPPSVCVSVCVPRVLGCVGIVHPLAKLSTFPPGFAMFSHQRSIEYFSKLDLSKFRKPTEFTHHSVKN